MSSVIDVTDQNFEEQVLNAELPVLLDFWAPWCGPCKMILSMLSPIAEEYAGKIRVCKMNIEENEKTPAQFQVRTVPTLKILKNGEVITTKVGAMTRGQLSAVIAAEL